MTAPNSCDNEPPLELPDVHKATLDADGLAALFADLAALPGAVEVRLKAAPTQRAEDAGTALERAHGLLRDGLVRGVQLIYAFDGQVWCDTLLRRGDGFALVRMAEQRHGG